MNVLVVDVEGEVAGIDILFDSGQTLGYRLLVLGTDDALGRQHLGMRLRAGDILLIEMFVDRQRRAKLLRDLGHAPKRPPQRAMEPSPFSKYQNKRPKQCAISLKRFFNR